MVASRRLSPQETRLRLQELTQRATISEPELAQKLTALVKWIKEKKDGLLTSKPYVLDLLTEVILDAELWFALQALNHGERLQFYSSENSSAAEQYWFEVLFPRWLSDQDPKFPNWRREVMKGNFKREDEPMLSNLAQEIEGCGGTYLWRHLLDLSMATDLLASGNHEVALCVQLTTVSGAYLAEKQRAWETTLQYWRIESGLLVSYSLKENLLVSRLAKVILRYSDAPRSTGYNVVRNL